MIYRNPSIPKVFYSDLSARPIENCAFCSKELLRPGVFYSIEKVIKNHRVDFEYAICFDCSNQMKSEMSEESIQNIERYMLEHRFEEKSREILFSEEEVDAEDFLKACRIKGTPVDELDEYQMIAVFEGDELSQRAFPIIIGIEAIEELNGLLSAKTKGEMDKYLDELTGLPPEFIELFKEKKKLLI